MTLFNFKAEPSSTNRKIALYSDYLEYFTKTLSGIPPTLIDFDTWDVAPFKEHGETLKPRFKEQDLNKLWDLTHGKTSDELNLHSQQVARLWRKYVKASLEKEPHKSQ